MSINLTARFVQPGRGADPRRRGEHRQYLVHARFRPGLAEYRSKNIDRAGDALGGQGVGSTGSRSTRFRPGNTLTGMVRRARRSSARDGLSGDEWLKMRRRLPAGAAGAAVEMAGVVAFLVPEDARYLTGQAIEVDGDWVDAVGRGVRGGRIADGGIADC